MIKVGDWVKVRRRYHAMALGSVIWIKGSSVVVRLAGRWIVHESVNIDEVEKL